MGSCTDVSPDRYPAEKGLCYPCTEVGELGVLMAESKLRELLRHFEERHIAAEFCDYVLGTLVDYDRVHNTDLLRTLRTYFRCNGNSLETAERLLLHRNSLLYRLQRIEDLLQVDLKDTRDRLALNLALELAELLQERLGEEVSEP